MGRTGNTKACVQLQLAVDTFAIQKILIINSDTLEVYAEVDYEESPPVSSSPSPETDKSTKTNDSNRLPQWYLDAYQGYGGR